MYVLGVLVCHALVIAGYVFRKRPPAAPEVKRGSHWSAGMLLQTVSVALVWCVPRDVAPPRALGVFAVVLAAASGALMVASLRELGRQFAYQARLVEGHLLIQTGPYAFVRNPIYLGLYGLSLAGALVYSACLVIPIFTLVFAAGTAIRVGSEERLLRDEFGPEFEAWSRRVPAVVPGLRSASQKRES